jgi:DnaJ-class molecular chaperone
MPDILAEIERRRDAGDDPCDSCHATGMYDGKVCTDCLGQKVLLTAAEYDAILLMAGHHGDDDSILDAEILIPPESEQ